jgi:ABC-type Fe3+/spermidine/putrescine transport system ATPase subunit
MIIQSGPPKQLYETPVDRDLAQFVGDANFIDGTLEQGRARTEFGLFSLANASPSAKDGVPITVMLRPEQIQVTGREDPQGHPAVIERCEYFGHDAVMSVRPLQAPSAGRLILRVLGHDTLPPGEKVWLKFPDAALSFPGVGPDLAAAVIIGDG